MRRRTALALAVAAAAATATAALAATASAKGITSLTLCGTGGCHRVDRAAVDAGLEAPGPSDAPSRPEPYYVLRGSSDETGETTTLYWLPRAGLARLGAQGPWARPTAGLRRGLHRAARGLRTRPAAGLGAIAVPHPKARVVEIFDPAGSDAAPAERATGAGANATVVAIAAALIVLAAVAALGLARTRRRPGRAPAALPPKAR
jgi:hypothetical protein